MLKRLMGDSKTHEPSLAVFRLGKQGFALPYESVLSVVSSQANTHHNQSGIRLKGHIVHNGAEVPLLKPEQFLSESSEAPTIQAYVIAKQAAYMVALPFDGFCKVLSPANYTQHTNELSCIEFEKLSVATICRQAGIEAKPQGQQTTVDTPLAKATNQHTHGKHFLIAQAGKYTLAMECQDIDFLFMASPIYTSKMSKGFFQGMARFQNDILPLIKLTDYLGLPDEEEDNTTQQQSYLTALVKTDVGLIGLTLDEMLARTSLSQDSLEATSYLAPPLQSIFHRQLSWGGKKVPVIEMMPIVQDSMLRGLTAMAKRLTKAHVKALSKKQPKQGCSADKVLSAVAYDRLCLKMEEVSTVLNLKDSTAVEIDHQKQEIRLAGTNEWMPLHDLGEVTFGYPLGLSALNYGIVMVVNNHKQVFGVEYLDRIDSIQWGAQVPRVGPNPALGVGSHIELVQIVDRGLQRRLSAHELNQMVSYRERNWY